MRVMKDRELVTEVLFVGQPYKDEPVYAEVSRAKPLALSIAHACGRRISPRIEELTHYNRVQLRWMKPDGRGGLVPRNQPTR
jgi:hypothetical protein